jgi:hypothetical protein
MRQGQSKRPRGRNRKGMNSATRSFESNGPDVKIRGTAAHIAEKYVQLARDSQTSGDIVAAENYFQHAEHYYRMLAAAQPPFQGHLGFVRADQDDLDDDYGDDAEENANPGEGPQPYASLDRGDQPREEFRPPREQQPYRESQNDQPRPRSNGMDAPRNGSGNASGGEQPSGGLPSFITGGDGELRSDGGESGDNGANGGRYGRSRRRRYPRAGRPAEGEGGSEDRAAAPTERGAPEPEPAPGE